MASDSASHAASQQSIKAYVDAQVSGLVDSAPAALNTLNELAAALGDDASFSTTIATSIGTKLAKASNLSDLANAGTARTNLGLGTGAVLDTAAISNGGTGLATADQIHTFVTDFGYTTNTGDITGVTAGTGLTGGGSSGGVTLNVIGGTGITANANDVAITAAQTGITSVLNSSLKLGYGASDAYINFGTDNQIDFAVDNANQVILSDGLFRPAGSNDLSLGDDIKRWSNVFTLGLNLGGGGSGTMTVIQTSSDSFSNDNTSLMTSAAIEDKILSYGYSTTTGDITGVTAGTGLSGGGASGAVTLNLDVDGLTDIGASIQDADLLIIDDGANGTTRKTTMSRVATWIGDNVSRMSIRDARNEGATTSSELLPNEFEDKAVGFHFTDDIASSTNAWDSVITMKGWSDDYRVWQLFSASDSSSADPDIEPLYFRSGEGDVNSGNWGARREVLTFPGTTPNADGSANQVLVTNGSGALSWANQTDTNTQLSTEQVQDIVGAMVSSNTETNIAVTYDDSGGKLNFASTDTNTTYSAGNGIALSGTTFKINDPVNLSQLTESTDATDDKILLWDESASLWKYMTLDNLQDSIDTTGGSGTTINNNADNRIITGSGTANTLNGEANLTWDGSTLIVSGGTGDAVLSLRADSDNSGELDQPYIDFMLDGTTIHSSIGHSSDVFHNDSTDNNTLIIANSVATNASGSGIVLKTGTSAGHENAVEALRINPDRKITFNSTYTFPLNDGSNGQVLTTNGSGSLSFTTVSGGSSSTTGGSKPVVYVDAGNTNVTTSETTIPFDTEVLDPSGNATLSTALGGDGTIRLAAAGYYEISYSIPINDDEENGGGSPDRTRIFAFMQTDDNENWTSPTTVTQSRSQVYTREASGGSGLSTSFIYEHTANDYIRIRIDQQKGTNISTETGQSQISIRLLSTAQDDAFVITGEESDDYITSEPAAGNANGFFPSYGNGAHNTTKSSSGTDFGIVVPFDCTLHRIDIAFGNKGSETNSSNQTITVFKNRAASTTTMTYNASGTSGNAFTKAFSSLSGNGLSYSAGDTFNLRATGLAGYTNTQVGPARMTATFLRTQ